MADEEKKKNEGVVNTAKPLKIALVLTKFRNSEVVTYEDRYGDRKRAVVIPLEDNPCVKRGYIFKRSYEA